MVQWSNMQAKRDKELQIQDLKIILDLPWWLHI